MLGLLHKKTAILLLLIALIGFATLITSCEPGGKLIIINQRNQSIQLEVTHPRTDGSIDGFTNQGAIPPNTTKSFYFVFLGPDWVNRFELVDSNGVVLFSHDYKMSDLDKINWTITIPQ
jgi:hypothetical protein